MLGGLHRQGAAALLELVRLDRPPRDSTSYRLSGWRLRLPDLPTGACRRRARLYCAADPWIVRSDAMVRIGWAGS